MTSGFDIQKILDMLPHRYPFLLIDRVIDMVAGEKIVALKNVTINEPFFQGHFPQMPVMPGVLIVEAMAQTGGVFYIASRPPADGGYIFYFMGMDKVRFRKPVVPGDQLVIEATLLKMRKNVMKMAAQATVDGRRVAEAELMATLGEKK
ncbi:MAG: 3-hydroxyacyl-ACP dehydratase FabZ [Desulfobacterales bacterium]